MQWQHELKLKWVKQWESWIWNSDLCSVTVLLSRVHSLTDRWKTFLLVQTCRGRCDTVTSMQRGHYTSTTAFPLSEIFLKEAWTAKTEFYSTSCFIGAVKHIKSCWRCVLMIMRRGMLKQNIRMALWTLTLNVLHRRDSLCQCFLPIIWISDLPTDST